ncbi:predicted protein [Lichtheimia corymbifera JMRC:FSU:9682]|uniref:Uncharacterized protein n=1 Tax=Lichtheimia corymbifera JMRC:FSU:9682 TaxID=1263082 RepID=A0A068RME3_9FUNG|nr:predicted protein [Lichtheimia corymbifera JMRC:FSU:9682]
MTTHEPQNDTRLTKGSHYRYQDAWIREDDVVCYHHPDEQVVFSNAVMARIARAISKIEQYQEAPFDAIINRKRPA